MTVAPDPDSPAGSEPPAVVEAMSDPSFYSHRPERVELIETHISWVFLAGELVYKLKKPLVLPFLDYGTLERRRAMCDEEVRLGRRLAACLYRGVRAIVRDGDRYALADPETDGACEFVVELVRFDGERTLAFALERDRATVTDVRATGKRLARFHATLSPRLSGSWEPSLVAASVGENFDTLLGFGGAIDQLDLWAGRRFAVAFLHGRRYEFARRVADGHVRECHGDLRAEHVILDHGVQVFDPVEFDSDLRLIDVSAEMAFLLMDLENAGRPDLAGELVDAYRAAGGDAGPEWLLYFYAAYRAWVRAKVAVVRADELQKGEAGRERSLGEARRLAALARRLAWRARGPLVLAICGSSATGKTHLAQELTTLSGLPHLNSDQVRKQLVGIAATARAPAEAYRRELSLQTYKQLGQRAAGALKAGGGAIVDATFRRRADRDAFDAGFGNPDVLPIFVECRAPADVMTVRARTRERTKAHVSDATSEIVERQRLEWEPLDEVAARSHVVLRTDRPLSQTVEQLEAALDARIADGSA